VNEEAIADFAPDSTTRGSGRTSRIRLTTTATRRRPRRGLPRIARQCAAGTRCCTRTSQKRYSLIRRTPRPSGWMARILPPARGGRKVAMPRRMATGGDVGGRG
jgi:hypothetical protein